jgi:hypothetical protein
MINLFLEGGNTFGANYFGGNIFGANYLAGKFIAAMILARKHFGAKIYIYIFSFSILPRGCFSTEI